MFDTYFDIKYHGISLFFLFLNGLLRLCYTVL